jgi:hypothetical protein
MLVIGVFNVVSSSTATYNMSILSIQILHLYGIHLRPRVCIWTGCLNIHDGHIDFTCKCCYEERDTLIVLPAPKSVAVQLTQLHVNGDKISNIENKASYKIILIIFNDYGSSLNTADTCSTRNPRSVTRS